MLGWGISINGMSVCRNSEQAPGTNRGLSLHSVAEIAGKRNVSMAQVALAWSLAKPYMTAPIVGTTSVEKLKDLIGKEVAESGWQTFADWGFLRLYNVEGVHLKLTEEETPHLRQSLARTPTRTSCVCD